MMRRDWPVWAAMICCAAGVGAGAHAFATQAHAKVYVVGEIEVRDRAAYQDYAPHVQGILARHGGRFLARGGNATALEGAAPAGRIVLIEFPDRASADAFWNSPDYRAIAPIRHRASEGRIFLVEGVPAR